MYEGGGKRKKRKIEKKRKQNKRSMETRDNVRERDTVVTGKMDNQGKEKRNELWYGARGEEEKNEKRCKE